MLSPDFVTEGHSVILEGKPGRGKTHLAIAVAYRAIQNGFDALFTTAAELIDELSAASRQGKLRDSLARFVRPHVLVVDEVGYLPQGEDAASVLYHVVNDRHIRKRAMIFTTNKHPKRWGVELHASSNAVGSYALMALPSEPSTCPKRTCGATITTSHQAAEFPEPPRTSSRMPRLSCAR